MSTVAVDLVFTALSDATRRQLLERLATAGPASASTIAEELPITRQAIAKHLLILESAGLVSRVRHGKSICFHAEAHQLAATGRWLQRMAGRWEDTEAVVSGDHSVAEMDQVCHAIQ